MMRGKGALGVSPYPFKIDQSQSSLTSNAASGLKGTARVRCSCLLWWAGVEELPNHGAFSYTMTYGVSRCPGETTINSLRSSNLLIIPPNAVLQWRTEGRM